jgi:hypothetical protein
MDRQKATVLWAREWLVLNMLNPATANNNPQRERNAHKYGSSRSGWEGRGAQPKAAFESPLNATR